MTCQTINGSMQNVISSHILLPATWPHSVTLDQCKHIVGSAQYTKVPFGCMGAVIYVEADGEQHYDDSPNAWAHLDYKLHLWQRRLCRVAAAVSLSQGRP